jgi:hypothetical protein
MLASSMPVGYDDGSPGCHNGRAEAATTAPRLLSDSLFSSSLFFLGEVSMDDETLRMMLRLCHRALQNRPLMGASKPAREMGEVRGYHAQIRYAWQGSTSVGEGWDADAGGSGLRLLLGSFPAGALDGFELGAATSDPLA